MTEKPEHKGGCDALGGYGQGVGPCSCGAAGRSVGEVLPVVGWRADDHSSPHVALTRGGLGLLGNRYGYPLTPHAPAQATIVAQAAEIERLKREHEADVRNNAEALKLLAEADAQISALKAKQIDVDAVMRLADEYAEKFAAQFYTHCPSDNDHPAAREALRAALTKDHS